MLVLFTLSILIWQAVYVAFGDSYSRETHVLRAIIIFVTIVPLTLAFWRADQKPIHKLLQVNRASLRDFGIGAVSWSIPALLGLLALNLIGAVQISTEASWGEVLATAGFLLVLVFVYEAFPEELLFRGYIFQKLKETKFANYAVLIQALLFTLWGALNGGENSLDRSLLFLVFALLVGTVRATTGSVWTAIGFHWAFQVVAQLLGSVGGLFTVNGAMLLSVVAIVLLPSLVSVGLLRLARGTSSN